MMNPMRGSNDDKLDALFAAYRTACPDRDGSANFMPELWKRIESRQRFTFSFLRMASGFVTAALALTIAMGIYMAIPHSNSNMPQSYLEALAEARPLDAPDYVTPAHLDLSDPGR